MPASSSTFQFGRLKRRPLSPCLHLFAGLDLIFVGAGWTPTRSWPWKQLTHGSLSPLPLSRHLGNRLQNTVGFSFRRQRSCPSPNRGLPPRHARLCLQLGVIHRWLSRPFPTLIQVPWESVLQPRSVGSWLQSPRGVASWSSSGELELIRKIADVSLLPLSSNLHPRLRTFSPPWTLN